MAFDPERDGWPLDEAIMRLSDPAALAAHARVCAALSETDGRRRLPPWWRDETAPDLAGTELPAADLNQLVGQQRLVIERTLVQRLTNGDLVGWGRHDSPVADYKLIPASAWPFLGARTLSWRWSTSFIYVEQVKSQGWVTQEVPKPRGATGPIIGSRHPRQKRERVTEITLRLYAVRIQPPAAQKQIGKSATEKEYTDWLIEMMSQHRDNPRTKNDLRPEAERRGLGKNAFDRAWRAAIRTTGAEKWTKGGRRPKSTQ